MLTFLCYAIVFVFSVNAQAFPSVLNQIGGSAVQQGILLSSLYFLFPLTSGGAGYVADRIGKRAVLLVGAAAMGTPFVVAALTSNIWAWIGAVLLFGVGSGILEGQASALVTDVNPGRERAVLNMSQLFYSIGAAGGPFLIAAALRLRPSTSLSAVMWVAALGSYTLFVVLLFVRKGQAVAPSPEPVGLRELVGDKAWRLLCLAIFLYVAVEVGTASWLAKYGHEVLGMSADTAPICIGLFWAGLGVSRAVVGLWDLPFRDRTILFGSTLAGLVVHCIAFLVHSRTAALVMFFAVGFCWGAVWPTLVSVAGRRFSRSTGAAIGIMVAAGAAAIPIVQPVIGLLSHPTVLGLRGALLVLAVLVIVNVEVIRRMHRSVDATTEIVLNRTTT